MTTAIRSIDPAVLRRTTGEAISVLRVLANEDRAAVPDLQGESRVSELEQRLHIHQPTLLQQLRNEGLMTAARGQAHLSSLR